MPIRKRIPLSEYAAQRIAIIKPSALGDIVHSLPVLTSIRHRYPDAHITWVVNRSYEPILKGHPHLNATLPFDRNAIRGGLLTGLRGYTRFFHRLRQERFDLVIDLQGLLRTGVMSLATRAARRVGLDSAREGARWFYTDLVRGADIHTMHAVDRSWMTAEAFGGDPGPKQFLVPICEKARSWVERSLHDHPSPWIMVAVGARWMTKRWPPVHFAMLARRAIERFGGSVIFVGGRDETPLVQVAMDHLATPALDLTGRTTLPQLAALLARADVMIGNDTGPLHLAVALGRPVVAPYTCTRIIRTGPYGNPHHAVETEVWCRGSYLKQCSRLECMAELTPDRLWPILESILQTWQHDRLSA